MDAAHASILPLEACADGAAGGKAAGLARLLALGLRVPAGFAIAAAGSDPAPQDLERAYRALGAGEVAVRSSAADEDGAGRSFAGQYRTVLGVRGLAALQRAVAECLASAEAARVAAYRDGAATPRPAADGGRIGLVVQRMVPAAKAGVLFTVDPVSARRDRLVIDAVAGLGEALVGGHARPDHHLLDRDGTLLERELAGRRPVLGDDEIERLAAEALAAEAACGQPLDLEWAIDGAGRIHWLQARPVTALGADPVEFDSTATADHVYTRANVGEMLPGAICPLDLDVTAAAIDQGIQCMLQRCGVIERRIQPLHTLAAFGGHLFIDLNAMLPMTRGVGGSSAEQLTLAICGRRVDELRPGPPASRPVRLRNGLRYIRYVFSAPRRVAALARRLRDFRLAEPDSLPGRWRAIDAALPLLVEAYEAHIQSSAGSGLAAGVLNGLLTRGRAPTAADEVRLARLLGGAGGVESADMVHALEGLVDTIAAQPQGLTRFATASAEAALAWLRSPAAGRAGRRFALFLQRHGHRALVELSLQQPGWRDDPLPLVRSMQAAVRARAAQAPAEREERSPALALRTALGLARHMVRRREASKSLLVETVDRFKRAYRGLGRAAAAAGRLPDAGAVFFLTHAELGRMARGEPGDWAARAAARRVLYDQQRRLRYPLLSVGAPAPLGDESERAAAETVGGVLRGNPVSPGRVRGRARVVRSLEQAETIQPGEILVTEVTDVGWSPYFRLIAGLATEVGSPISHGAVVAREYGLPAVVNLAGACHAVASGRLVELDGEAGTLRLLDERPLEEPDETAERNPAERTSAC